MNGMTQMRRLPVCAAALLVCALLAGCGHKKNAARMPAPQAAPPVAERAPARSTERAGTLPPPGTKGTAETSGRLAVTPMPEGGASDDDLRYVESHGPIYSFEGNATWYRAPYKGRKAANGQVFDDDAMTAANRTLPMGTLIAVTNLKTGQTAAMRVSDRGPFAPDKVIDLTIASAKAVGVYRVGTAKVRIDVYRAPKPLDTGGRWCVQIGAFTSEERAERLKAQLLDQYPDAKVIEFPGEKSYWVRIRPQGDDRGQAEYIARHLQPEEGDAYLTRLD